MKAFTLEEITQITGGMLTKVSEAKIEKIAPPLLEMKILWHLLLVKMKLQILQSLKLKLRLCL